MRAGLPVEVVLVRHAEPDWETARHTNVEDPSLTAFGREQAVRVARELKNVPLAALHCSPLARARETAQAIAEVQQLTPDLVPDLEEIRVPLLHSASQSEVDSYFASAARRPLDEHWSGFPGGEPFRDFHARVTRGIESVLERYGVRRNAHEAFSLWKAPERAHTLRIGVVGHGGTNGVIVTHLLGIPPVPWEWIRFETRLAAFSVLALRPINSEGHIWSLQQFGRGPAAG